MLFNTKILIRLGTVFALTVLPMGLDQSQANSESLQKSNSVQERIIGTWRIFVDPEPGPAGDPLPFYAYATFNSEGTLVQSSSDSLEGSRLGHGVWKRTGKNELKAVFEKFIDFNPLTQQPGGVVFRVEEVINLTGKNSYQGLGKVSICNTAGQDCQPIGTALTKASRLTVD